ncbi:MAG: hypothetical protein A3F11_03040 [Gammaproteobacteria bacterium RIFCSPHIGHO2_12_FULL_37_14]|nr:MAG: hypothetical protein A3F11_03040 [Gammaproteobacteria bacterium RIFCSPHIGHO2_12_FULL_37_14]
MGQRKKGFVYIVKSILFLINPSEWRKILPLFCFMLLSAILNAVGIAMVVPFIAVASTPSLIRSTSSLQWVYYTLHFNSDYHFLFFLGVVALLLLLVGNVLNILVGWLSAKVTYSLKYRWANNFLASYLAQPYLFFLNTRTSELSRNLLREISQLSGIVLTIFDLFSKCLSTTMILLMLVLVNPLPAISIMISVGIIYAIIFLCVKNLLKKTSYYSHQAGQQTFKITEEIFSMIKEVKLYHKELAFLESFELPTRLDNHYSALYCGIIPTPRYLIEIFAFGGVILLVLYLLLSQQNLSFFLPMLGFFVVSLYRIMPLTQSIFGEISSILSGTHCVEAVLNDYKRLNIEGAENKQLLKKFVSKKLVDRFSLLELKKVCFQYPNTFNPAISQLDLTLPAGKVIAFVGPSGAGKTTIVDILLGFLQPQLGQIIVNGILLDSEEKIRSWQPLVSYVPQAIALSNSSIKQNIAFGEAPDVIDMTKVKHAVETAQLREFVESLPDKYETEVGDRGIRLSGGQRQRIGIARALYRDPQVLILDEATNALDGLTEMEIMQNIHALAREKTIIIIAHRLQTVMACDHLHYIDSGHLVATGTYEELATTHAGFKDMIEAAAGGYSVPRLVSESQ